MKISLTIGLLLLLSSLSYAAEYEYKYEDAPASYKSAAAASDVPAPPPAESERAKDWKNIQAQEQWVARLKKQTDGEVRQLSEMRATLAEKNKLKLEKLEAGDYIYDQEKDKFLER